MSCNKIMPAGFWKNYENHLLVTDISDQGPYGGHRAMHWENVRANIFNSKNAIDFAISNGWVFVDSSKFESSEIENWQYSNQPVFPLSHTGFDSSSSNNSTHSDFPRWIVLKLHVYKFKTGWITINPGTDDSMDENGFIVISNDGSKMSVYHLWGE